MKYTDSQILDFVYSNTYWEVTEGCPCISVGYDSNTLFVCLYQDENCEDYIEVEVISHTQTKDEYGFRIDSNSEYIKKYCLGEEHHDKLKELYLRCHDYKMSA